MRTISRLACVAIVLGFSVNVANSQPRPTPPLTIDDPNLNINFDNADANIDFALRQRIIAAANFAFQQVDAAVSFMRTSTRSIRSGTNALYNTFMGRFYDTTGANGLLGTYDQTITAHRVTGEIFTATGFDAMTRMFTFGSDDFVGGFRVGDRVMIGGTVFTVAAIELADPMGGGGGGMTTQVPKRREIENGMGGGMGGGGGGATFMPRTLESITVVERIPPDVDQGQNGLELRRVVGDVEIANPEHHERSLATFEAIREALRGELNFFGDLDIAEAQAAYDAAVVNGDMLTVQAMDFNSLQRFGTSNSDSDEAEAARLANAADPNSPLLFWGEDNDAAGNPPREHFESQLKAVADVQDGTDGKESDITLGRPAMTEFERHIGALFDGTLSNVEGQTEFLLFEMIISALGVSGDTDALHGVQAILDFLGFPQGDSENPHIQNRDADNFARLASRVPLAGAGPLPRPDGKNRQDNQVVRDDGTTIMVPGR